MPVQVEYAPTSGEGVYILKMSAPLGNENHQAQYYIGWARDLEARLHFHRTGRGAAFTRAAAQQGIEMEVVVWIPGASKKAERWIKNQKNTAVFVRRFQERPEFYRAKLVALM